MNTNKQKADRLTRELLNDCHEIPPKGMDLRIMELIKKEVPVKRPCVVKDSSCMGGVIFLAIGYVILIVCLVIMTMTYKDDLGSIYFQLKEAFPYILSLIALGSSFVFYSMIDRVMSFTK